MAPQRPRTRALELGVSGIRRFHMWCGPRLVPTQTKANGHIRRLKFSLSLSLFLSFFFKPGDSI